MTTPHDPAFDIVHSCVRSIFPEGMIQTVDISRNVDHCGDPTLDVRVLFKGVEHLDGQRMLSVMARTWRALNRAGEPAFPMFSFSPARSKGRRRARG